jgi:hypothetical protein
MSSQSASSTKKRLVGKSFSHNRRPNPISEDNAVPFGELSPGEYRERGKFDFIVLTISPKYTTRSADNLIPVGEG